MHPSVYVQANLDRWNELTAIHARSAFYDVAGFKAGKSSLRPLEIEELGDVAGKSLLHLQCHFGLDTLSWARRGARVTGVDFSPEAIALARSLSAELGIPAEFICADVCELPATQIGPFDVVFTSYGALCWLPDLPRWARVVAHFLKPGGTFYMAELHPFALTLDDRSSDAQLRVGYSYFTDAGPMRCETPGTYADRDAPVRHKVSYEWVHTLGEIVTALLGVGLRLEFLHEFPYCVCPLLPSMEQGPDGWWHVNGQPGMTPFLFSVKATKQP